MITKRSSWGDAASMVRHWTYKSGVDHRLLILNQIWEREVGLYSRFWALTGVRRGFLYIKTRSPAAAQDLQLRGNQIVRDLNKYFKKAWIRGIRQARG